jgi:signal transduction histidine kinase
MIDWASVPAVVLPAPLAPTMEVSLPRPAAKRPTAPAPRRSRLQRFDNVLEARCREDAGSAKLQAWDEEKSRELAEASKHKSQFLANMSHELRTPLNAILGYTELILDSVYGEMPEKARSVLERVQRNGRHLLGLINDVLDMSKIEAGQLVLALADYSLKTVVETVYTAVEQLAKEKKLTFKVEVPADLPPGHGDERRLTQVLLNLVGNAIKFTDTGKVMIKASTANGSFNVAATRRFSIALAGD